MAQRASRRAWYLRNRERILAQQAARVLTGDEVEAKRAYDRQRYQRNRQTILANLPSAESRRQPCAKCGGPKEPGHRRQLCAACGGGGDKNARRRKPCPVCGGPKGPGQRKGYCDGCRDAGKADVARRNKMEGQQRRRVRLRAEFVEVVEPLVVLERDDGVCGICGGDVDPFDFHVDHIVPLARAGEHSYANVQAAHPGCNMRKGAK